MKPQKNLTFILCAVLLCIISAIAATGLARYLKPKPTQTTQPAPKDKTDGPDVPNHLFENWPRPEVALLLSGEQHGYLGPCGCSRPQTGGMERRYNLLQKLKAKWPVVAMDLGDIPQNKGIKDLPNIQGLLKYKTAMKALKVMDYSAVGVGQYETQFPLLTALSEYALNEPNPPSLLANVKDREETFPGMLEALKVQTVKNSSIRVGIASVMGPSVEKKLQDKNVKLVSNGVVLPQLVKALAQQKTNLNVLLYQGSTEEAKLLAKDFPQFHVLLCLGDDPEPPSDPIRVGNQIIVNVGHKGRYVGVVGVYPTKQAGQPFTFRYQLVNLTEDFLTPEDKRKEHAVVQLMEEYTRTLKSENYLAKYGQRKHPMQIAVPGVTPTYVGSQKCKSCHGRIYRDWSKTKHAHAWEALVEAKYPSHRQFDAECVVCHTVGFGYESGFKDIQKDAHLMNVGCESCHGPASAHVADTDNKKWHELMTPWNKNEKKIERFCIQCHDTDNDVKWNYHKRLPEVDHWTEK